MTVLPASPRRALTASSTRRTIVLLILAVIATGLLWPPSADGQDSDLTGTPQADCGPGSDPEGEIQGRVPAEDYESGRTDRPYTCNTELVGQHGSTGGFKVHRYVDASGQECAYYDSTLAFPTDLLSQATTGAGVIVLDMSDPSNPVTTTTLTSPAMLSPHESLVLNTERGLLVAVAGTAATFLGIVDIYDVSEDCTQPELQSTSPIGLLGHESGISPDGMTFYATSTTASTIVAIDISDPTLPTPVAFLPLNSHGITVSDDGNRLYTTPLDVSSPIPGIPTLGALQSGIAIIDVSAIQAREPLAQGEVVGTLAWPEASIPQTAIPVTIDGSPYLVEVDEFVDFADFASPIDGIPGAARIIDISDETDPFVVSNIRLDVHDPAIRTSDAGLEDDPGASQGVRAAPQGYTAHYCAVPQREDPGIMACSMIASGLRVFDIRDPQNPVEIAYFNRVTPQDNNPISTGGAYAMSAPTFVPERGEIWYSDVNSGFHAVRLTNGVWPFDAAVERLGGPTRIETAVAASTATFADGAAGSAVLARDDDFADSMAAGPLAVATDGPLLLSGTDALPAATAAELTRALAPGATVFLMGGEAALSSGVADAVTDLGFTVARLGGANRFETAVEIAEEITASGDPARIVVADGGTFADAAVASPVAGSQDGVLVLSDGTTMPDATAALLDRFADVPVTAVGAAASEAVSDPDAQRLDGSESGDVSVDVARAVFGAATRVGVARSDVFADALTAGAVLGRGAGSPLLLVDSASLPAPVAAHLREAGGRVTTATLFGGTAAITDGVRAAIAAALGAE